MRQLRVSWCSNPTFSPSGYSQQTFDIEKLFIKAGWDSTNFSLINMFGHAGAPFKDSLGITNYPLINHPTGSDAMVFHGKHFKADCVIGLFDVHTQDMNFLSQVNRFIPWLPVDYDPMPGVFPQFLKFSNRIIAMSKFGQDQLQRAGFSSTYIPHHVDTSIFKPLNKAEVKQSFGINPEVFVFGMVGANKDIFPRKSFQQVLEAFKQFLQKHPKSLLYIHTNPSQMPGFPVEGYANFLGIRQHLLFPDLYKRDFDTSKEEMNRIFNMFDVLLSPSSSEGFNIPVIEGQAAGTPVIVNDWTSMPELIVDGVTGYKTKVGCKHFMPIGSYMAWPDAEDLYQQMIRIKGMKLDIMGKSARSHIMKNYDMHTIWEKNWTPFLNRLEQEVYPNILTIPQVTA